MENPDAIQLVVSVITVAIAAFLGRISRAIRTGLFESKRGDRAEGSDRREWWFVLLSPLIVVGAAFIGASVTQLEQIHWNAITLGISAAMAIRVRLACQSIQKRLAEPGSDVNAKGWERRKWWSILPTPLVLAGVAMIGASVPQPWWHRLYWDVSALGITPPMAVSIGSVCQALRKKIADCQGHDHANGRWSSLLASLIFIETALIGVSLLIVNRVYWSLVQAGTAGLSAMAASLITVVAIFGFGAFLLVTMGKTLRKRWLMTRELLIYASGAGIIMALPLFVRRKTTRWGDLINIYYNINWSSLFLALVLLTVVAFHIRRMSRQ